MKFHSLITAASVSLCTAVAHAQLSEPDTVFYGKVLHHGGGEPHVLTTGNLTWRVLPPSGGDAYAVKASLTSWDNGQFSYNVRIPRNIAVSGLPEYSVPAGLPMLSDATLRYRNAEILVNGRPARLADPAVLSFAGDGKERAGFIRADIIVDFPLPDTDADGLPDWWEEKYGLDPQLAATTITDTDGDGITDAAEYAGGTHPVQPGTAPQLAQTGSLTVPEQGRTALLLNAQDSDTPGRLLRYTLRSLPAGVFISVLNGQSDGKTDRPVAVGSTFTQADISSGQVIVTSSNVLTDASIALTLVDEVPGRIPLEISLPVTTAVRSDLLAAAQLRSATTPNGLTLHYAAAATRGVTLQAASASTPYAAWTTAHGADEPRLLIGSPQNDTLLGSGENDVLCAGGGTNTLRGGTGADRFVFTQTGTTDSVPDFSAAESDVLDLSALLTPTAGRPLSAYVSLQNGTLSINANGDGSGYTDASISLPPTALPAALDDAWDAGLIDAGDTVPRTSLFLTGTSATEENLTPGQLTIRRRGSAANPLTLALSITGTATAGVDYTALPGSVTFAADQKLIQLPITPQADDVREPTETIQISLTAAPGYDLATSSISFTLTDLPSRVWLEVVERTAFKDSLTPAQLLLRRSGPLAAPLTALILTSGRATPGLDYRRPGSSYTFAAGQDVVPLDITPLASATLSGGCEDVTLTVKSDASYLFGATPSAQILICLQPATLDSWVRTQLPGTDPDNRNFLEEDPDHDGFSGLMEFALNLNPQARDSGPKTHTTLFLDANGCPGLEYRRRTGAPEIRSQVMQSSDLQHWTPLDESNSRELPSTLEGDGMEKVRHCLNAKPASGTVYLRLKVSRRE